MSFITTTISEDKDYFFRQRRNLTIFSLLVIFFEVGNLQIDGFNLFSVRGEFDSAIINPFLHGILIYFLWRYSIAFLSIAGIRNTLLAYENDIRQTIKQTALKEVKEYIVQANKKRRQITPDLSSLSFANNDEQAAINGHDIINGACFYFNRLEEGKRIEINHEIYITDKKLLKLKLKVFAKHFFQTNLFLEFYFPFILCFIAIIESLGLHITMPILFLLNW